GARAHAARDHTRAEARRTRRPGGLYLHRRSRTRAAGAGHERGATGASGWMDRLCELRAADTRPRTALHGYRRHGVRHAVKQGVIVSFWRFLWLVRTDESRSCAARRRMVR